MQTKQQVERGKLKKNEEMKAYMLVVPFPSEASESKN